MERPTEARHFSTAGFWFLFAVTQALALILSPLTSSFHANPFPLLFAFALLLPGSLIDFGHMPERVSFVLMILINAPVWYLARRLVFAADGVK
jgi:hypothetical protein